MCLRSRYESRKEYAPALLVKEGLIRPNEMARKMARSGRLRLAALAGFLGPLHNARDFHLLSFSGNVF